MARPKGSKNKNIRPVRDRFWAKVDIDVNGCWEWKGAKNSEGYGTIGINGKIKGTHRVSWWLAHGEWPSQFVLHKCDNPSCVRPSHLFLGNNSDNMKDKFAKGRDSNRGERNPARKLTQSLADEIRSKLTGEWGELTRLAMEYDVSIATIWNIKHGKKW